MIAFANPDGGTIFVKYSLDNNQLTRIEVGEGSYKPYYLRSKGLKPSGVYVRQGASSAPASPDQIRQMIKNANNAQMESICSKVICLNKALNGCFYSYKAQLPSIFLLVHPVGTVIGNAKYEDFLVIYQNVTIHTPQVCEQLKLGKGLFLGAGAQVVGNYTIGDRVSIGAGTTLSQQLHLHNPQN